MKNRNSDLLDRPIAYHRAFVEFGGIKAAVFLSQCVYWSKRTKDKDGWFWKTVDEWQEETGLTKREQEMCKFELISNKVLEVQRKGEKGINHYRVDISEIYRRMGMTRCAENAHSDVRKTHIQMCGKRISHNKESETTTETTSHSCGENAAGKDETVDKSAADIVAVIDSFRDTGLWPIPNYGNRTERKAADTLAKKFGVEAVKGAVERYAAELETNPYLPKGHKPTLFLENMGIIGAKMRGQASKGRIEII